MYKSAYTLLDGTIFPREYQMPGAGLVSASEHLEIVGKKCVTEAVERLLDERSSLFQIKTNAVGEAVRFLILASPGSGWLDPTDLGNCQDTLQILGERPTDKDHEIAVNSVLRYCHPLYRLAFLGGDIINAERGDYRGEWPKRCWFDQTNDSYGYARRAGAYGWVWPVSRRIEMEDMEQQGIKPTREEAEAVAEAYFVNVIHLGEV